MTWIVLIAIIVYIIFYISKQETIKEAEKEYEEKVKSDLLRRQRLKEERDLEQFRKDKKEYLQSSEWHRKRQERLIVDDFNCQLCSYTNNLQVHHKTYKNIFNEDVEHDLVTLCSDCHTAIHEKYGYPQNLNDYETGWFWKKD